MPYYCRVSCFAVAHRLFDDTQHSALDFIKPIGVLNEK
jgi:hypothetical protein